MVTRIVYTLAALVALSLAKTDKSEFVNGFNTGIFLEKSRAETLETYECPEILPENIAKQRASQILGPLKTVGDIIPDKNIKTILASTEIFMNSLDRFTLLFETEYKGNDFCKGLEYGMTGA